MNGVGLRAGAKGGSQPSEPWASGTGCVSTLTSTSPSLSLPSGPCTHHCPLGPTPGQRVRGRRVERESGWGRQKEGAQHARPAPSTRQCPQNQGSAALYLPRVLLGLPRKILPFQTVAQICEALPKPCGGSSESAVRWWPWSGTNGVTVLHLDQTLPAF